jgi:hypothetical protein
MPLEYVNDMGEVEESKLSTSSTYTAKGLAAQGIGLELLLTWLDIYSVHKKRIASVW